MANAQYILYRQELSHLVDVDRVRLLPLSLALLLVALGDSLGGLARLGGSFTRGLGWHGLSLFSICKNHSPTIDLG